MVKRCYCDYCDTSYPYSVEARKKHSHGHLHQKLKKLHYEQFQSAKDKLEKELKKEKCRNYHSGRHCSYGESCIYSHLSPHDIENLKRDAEEEERNMKRAKLPTLESQGIEPSIKKWMSNWSSEEGTSGQQAADAIEEFRKKYKLSDYLKEHSNLPPSLIPPTIDDLLSCTFQEWG